MCKSQFSEMIKDDEKEYGSLSKKSDTDDQWIAFDDVDVMFEQVIYLLKDIKRDLIKIKKELLK